MATAKSVLEDAFSEGYSAYYRGDDEHHNPYTNLKGEWWDDGWEDASDEANNT